MRTGLQFISAITSRISRSSSLNQSRVLETDLNRVFVQYASLHLHKTKQTTSLRALPEDVVSALLQLIDPESKITRLNVQKQGGQYSQ